MTKLIAHRGASLLALENTKKAFELAGASNKVYGIETDIWLTPDNV
jgi:glycerophosphoryl diester phosphodiesterase